MLDKTNIVKERPILFTGEMVRAILAGQKTMTRQVMKPQPELRPGTMKSPMGKRIDTAYWHWKDEWWWQDPQQSTLDQCPYGQPGDRLCCASRITLEITGVRVEPLWRMAVDDMLAEGVPEAQGDDDDKHPLTPFIKLWDSINAKRGYPWSDNPWVWVIEFRKLSDGGESG